MLPLSDRSPTVPEKVVRKDARRNRARIVDAARDAFAVDGLDTSAAAIARRAQVGTATLYRHFPTRPDLIDAVFGEEAQHCLSLLTTAIHVPDAWQGLRQALDAVVELELAAPGLANRITTSERSTTFLGDFNRRVRHDLAFLANRLRDEGRARTDLTGADIALLLTAVRAIAVSNRTHVRERCRRYITMTIDGLRSPATT